MSYFPADFELEVGDWNAAYARFVEELLPIAVTSEDALTDAPALAWRWALRAGRNAKELSAGCQPVSGHCS